MPWMMSKGHLLPRWKEIAKLSKEQLEAKTRAAQGGPARRVPPPAVPSGGESSGEEGKKKVEGRPVTKKRSRGLEKVREEGGEAKVVPRLTKEASGRVGGSLQISSFGGFPTGRVWSLMVG